MKTIEKLQWKTKNARCTKELREINKRMNKAAQAGKNHVVTKKILNPWVITKLKGMGFKVAIWKNETAISWYVENTTRHCESDNNTEL